MTLIGGILETLYSLLQLALFCWVKLKTYASYTFWNTVSKSYFSCVTYFFCNIFFMGLIKRCFYKRGSLLALDIYSVWVHYSIYCWCFMRKSKNYFNCFQLFKSPLCVITLVSNFSSLFLDNIFYLSERQYISTTLWFPSKVNAHHVYILCQDVSIYDVSRKIVAPSLYISQITQL